MKLSAMLARAIAILPVAARPLAGEIQKPRGATGQASAAFVRLIHRSVS